MNLIKLVVKNLTRNLSRTVVFVCAAATAALIGVATSCICVSLSNGLVAMGNRLGYDIVAVPEGKADTQSDVIMQGVPGTFYMSKSVIDEIKDLDGVASVTEQFYLQSLSASCCSFPIQIIGYDASNDTSISSWIESGSASETGVIVGSDVGVSVGGIIKIFGREYEVAAKMSPSGTGLDYTLYVPQEVLGIMVSDATANGVSVEDPDEYTSTVCVVLEEDTDAEAVAEAIGEIDGVDALTSSKVLSQVASSMSFISAVTIGISVVVCAAIILLLVLMFEAQYTAGKKEAASLKLSGASRRDVLFFYMLGAAISCGVGAFVGSILGVCAVAAIEPAARASAVPVVFSWMEILAVAAIWFVGVCAAGTVSAVSLAVRLSSTSASYAIRR